jgi:hypothetical protein
MQTKSELSNRIKAITGDPEVDDFFIVISSKTGTQLEGKTIGPDLISALAKAILEQEGGLSIINRMQLAIFKAKDKAKQMMEEKVGLIH